MRKLPTLLLALVALGATACVNIRTPLDTNVEATPLGTKVGKAHWQSILGLVAWGDSGVHAAAKNGDITVVEHLDEELVAVLFFLYVKRTTVAYGD